METIDLSPQIGTRLLLAGTHLRTACEWQANLPLSKQLKLAGLAAHLERVARMIMSGQCIAARKLHNDFADSPAAQLGRRKKGVREAPSELKQSTARTNGRSRVAGSGWCPLPLEGGRADGTERWQQRQAVALLTEIQLRGQNCDAWRAVANHEVSVRIERAVFNLLQEPRFSAASALLPSRWHPKPSATTLRKISMQRLKRLRRIVGSFVEKPRLQSVEFEKWEAGNRSQRHAPSSPKNQPVELKVWNADGTESKVYGPFDSPSDILIPDDVYNATRVVLRLADGTEIELPAFITPEGRRLRKMIREMMGPKAPVHVRIAWRGSDRQLDYGPFPFPAAITVPWSHLNETDVFVRFVRPAGEESSWQPVPLPGPKPARRHRVSSTNVEKELIRDFGRDSIFVHHHRVCVRKIPHTSDELQQIFRRVPLEEMKSFSPLAAAMVHRVKMHPKRAPSGRV